MRATFLDYQSLSDLDLHTLHESLESLQLYEHSSTEQIVKRLQHVEVAITNKAVLDAAVFAACPDLRLVLVSATGTNNVDLAAARAAGVTVCNCQGYGTASVAQHCMMLLLALATRLPDYQQAVRQGRWQQASQFCLLDYPIVELAGKTLGILGYGELGSAVARLARAFDMQVVLGQLPERPAQADRLPLPELLATVDVLSLHCPLTEQTRHIISAEQLALMKPSAFLLNTARGGLVDEQALADCLRSGHLAGAATDVLSQEPPRHGNPLLAEDIPRLIITPHNAWGSNEARQRIIDQLVENIRAYRAGAPIRVVG